MKNQVQNECTSSFFQDIKLIFEQARQKAYNTINATMIEAYWLTGKRIVEQEQQGKERADYGTYLIKILSDELTSTFGKGFGERSLRHYRQFYLAFPDLQIWNTCVPNLTWSHFRRLLGIENQKARIWYLKAVIEEQWSVRTLDRNINTQYYERLLLSQHQEIVREEMIYKTAVFQKDKLEFIKNPFVIEFLGISSDTSFTETNLETAIINNIQKFIMELGKGYAFVARQQHIRTNEADYYIDLVFYNYILKCFVIIDLKTSKISYEDVGQMDMYLQMYDKLKKQPEDNPTIGIILCSETNEDVAQYSTLAKNEQMFASKYKLYLPTKEELRNEIERQKLLYNIHK